MKKNLLLSSLFVFNICLPNEESLATSDDSCVIAKTATVQSFVPTSFVLDFIVEPNEVNEIWSGMIQKTEEFIVACEQNSEMDAMNGSLQLTKALYDIAVDQNNLHGCITCKAYETNDNVEVMEQKEDQNSIIIRFSVTQINDQNQEVWQNIQNAAYACMQTLENGTDYPYESIFNFVHEVKNYVDSDCNGSFDKNIFISAFSTKSPEEIAAA